MRTTLTIITLTGLCLVLAALPAAAADQPSAELTEAAATSTQAEVLTDASTQTEVLTDASGILGGVIWLAPVEPCGDETWSCTRDIPTPSPCFAGGVWWAHQTCTCSWYCTYYNCVTNRYFCAS